MVMAVVDVTVFFAISRQELAYLGMYNSEVQRLREIVKDLSQLDMADADVALYFNIQQQMIM